VQRARRYALSLRATLHHLSLARPPSLWLYNLAPSPLGIFTSIFQATESQYLLYSLSVYPASSSAAFTIKPFHLVLLLILFFCKRSTNLSQHVLSSCRTLLSLPVSLLQARHRPMCCSWPARPHGAREDSPRGLRLCQPQQPPTRSCVRSTKRAPGFWVRERWLPLSIPIATPQHFTPCRTPHIPLVVQRPFATISTLIDYGRPRTM
jgi:hypothetical protein